MQDNHWLEMALSLAKKAPACVTYAVGCVIVDIHGQPVATGYTGELSYPPGSQPASAPHAEEIALSRLPHSFVAPQTTLYCSMEPCSERKSGRQPCTQRIIESGIGRVVFGAHEPFNPALGIHCRGMQELQVAGLQVIQLSDLAETCLKTARRDDS